MTQRLLAYLYVGISLCIPTGGYANPHLQLSAAYQVIHAEGLIRSADIALVGVTNLFRKNDSARINPLIIHNALNRQLNSAPGLRALFTTDAVGQLQHDSFKFPTRDLDLNDRDYFQEALGLKENDVYIGDSIAPTFFNLGSLPLSRPIFSTDGYIKGVAVALLSPDNLLHRQKICKKCVVSIFKTNGHKITSFPSKVSNQPEILAFMKAFPENQIIDVQINAHKTKTVWVKFPNYKLVLLYSHFN